LHFCHTFTAPSLNSFAIDALTKAVSFRTALRCASGTTCWYRS
jgi:hypothetical protein